MSIDNEEFNRRSKLARAAIRVAHGTEGDSYGATLFVSHHLEEIDDSYWEERFQTASPSSSQVLDSLILRTEFDEEEDGDSFDFTLPGDVTTYVICVTFDDDGDVEDITMES